jgi:hypothetical protein
VGDNKKAEYIQFYHPSLLRILIEKHLMIDLNYKTVQQRDVDTLRAKNVKIYWNIIYYFHTFDLPFEFLIPYEDKTLFKDFQSTHLKV